MNLPEIRALCKQYQYGWRVEGENPQLVLVGEEHTEASLPAQERLIEIVRPQVILHECADTAYIGSHQATRTIIGWAQKYATPVELFDIPTRNPRSPKISKSHIEQTIWQLLEDMDFEAGNYPLCLDMTSPLREEYMAQIIDTHVQRHHVPLIAVTGVGHVLPVSRLIRSFHRKNIPYVTVIQQQRALEFLQECWHYFQTE